MKLADKICNLRDITLSPPSEWSLERRRDYYDWAKEVVDGLRELIQPKNIFDELSKMSREQIAVDKSLSVSAKEQLTSILLHKMSCIGIYMATICCTKESIVGANGSLDIPKLVWLKEPLL